MLKEKDSTNVFEHFEQQVSQLLENVNIKLVREQLLSEGKLDMRV